ncbi:MAG: hypothetical protein QXI12_12825 [Candidatus Methanomethyliaceae archaeon]
MAGERWPVQELELQAHDFLFYVSQEQEAGYPAPWLHNTALLYAFNRDVPEVSRNAAGSVPFYEQDRPRFRRYVTPGVLNSGQDPVRISWNAVDSTLVFRMEKERVIPAKKLVIPKFGAYYRYVPYDTRARVYLIGPPAFRIVRLGKKLIPVAVKSKPPVMAEVRRGRFRAAHPVNILDLQPGAMRLLEGQLCPLPPYPLYYPALLEGPYLELPSESGRHAIPLGIALPDSGLFPGVFAS